MNPSTTTAPPPAQPADSAATALATFVGCAQLMLDPATSEPVCRRTETRLLQQLPILRAMGAFELFAIRDPALAALVRDELEQRPGNDSAPNDACCRAVHTRTYG